MIVRALFNWALLFQGFCQVKFSVTVTDFMHKWNCVKPACTIKYLWLWQRVSLGSNYWKHKSRSVKTVLFWYNHFWWSLPLSHDGCFVVKWVRRLSMWNDLWVYKIKQLSVKPFLESDSHTWLPLIHKGWMDMAGIHTSSPSSHQHPLLFSSFLFHETPTCLQITVHHSPPLSSETQCYGVNTALRRKQKVQLWKEKMVIETKNS